MSFFVLSTIKNNDNRIILVCYRILTKTKADEFAK